MLGVTFQNLCGKQKGHKSMSVDTPTIIYFEIYMCLRAQRGVSLHGSEPSNRLVLPDVKGQRGISKAERAIRVKRHAI